MHYNAQDCNVTYILLMNKVNCALKLVDEIILYYYARSKKHQIMNLIGSYQIILQIIQEINNIKIKLEPKKF